MKNRTRFTILITLALAILITACVPISTPETQYIVVTATLPTVSVTNTPDPCAPANIEAEVLKVHKYMREFDDSSSLAASVPAAQLSETISNLQRIRREAEDQPVPPCLATLKTYQISHMNVVIGTLINLIGYANGTVSKEVIDQGILLARQEHDKYTIELARVLGLTMVPASNVTAPAQTPNP